MIKIFVDSTEYEELNNGGKLDIIVSAKDKELIFAELKIKEKKND